MSKLNTRMVNTIIRTHYNCSSLKINHLHAELTQTVTYRDDRVFVSWGGRAEKREQKRLVNTSLDIPGPCLVIKLTAVMFSPDSPVLSRDSRAGTGRKQHRARIGPDGGQRRGHKIWCTIQSSSRNYLVIEKVRVWIIQFVNVEMRLMCLF